MSAGRLTLVLFVVAGLIGSGLTSAVHFHRTARVKADVTGPEWSLAACDCRQHAPLPDPRRQEIPEPPDSADCELCKLLSQLSGEPCQSAAPPVHPAFQTDLRELPVGSDSAWRCRYGCRGPPVAPAI